MPNEEKKKFKAVTEEIVSAPPQVEKKPDQPVSIPPQEVLKVEERHQKEIAKIVGVPETNNIITHGQGTSSKKSVVFFIAIMLLVAFIVMALAGGIYVYLNGVKNLPSSTSSFEIPFPTSAALATPVPSPSASSSATSKPDYSLFNVSVLNGSGAIGAATNVRDLVQKGGFKVSYVGNADNFNFPDTIIQVKNTVSADVVAALRNLLVSTYSVKIGSPLTAQSRYDIVITVGSK